MDENKYDEFIEENISKWAISVDQLQRKNENKNFSTCKRLLIRIRQKIDHGDDDNCNQIIKFSKCN